MNIGWVGLGSIGTEMAKQALKAGHAVTVYGRGQGLEAITAAGAAVSQSYAEIAGGCDLLGLCVFKDAQLREVLLDGGALAAMKPGSVVVIHTTGSPALARELGERAPAGVAVIDATFSGGPANVIAGTLALMIGGEDAAIAKARPLIDLYADKLHHVGPLGHGQMLKLVNNLLFAANVQNAVEAMRMVEAQGLDVARSARILQDCSGGSYASALLQHMSVDRLLTATRGYMEKDVAAAMASARDTGLDTSAFAATEAYFRPS
ncbi:NAD(P)-dependent oxidoreductase [Novosphingobium bradum]|uniref:NAD(P)-dependent oxidoreductase n=1 Tax=Novosphingobium bradum TaxID=1737444 RepID=A0ABV7IJG1_9SPHN